MILLDNLTKRFGQHTAVDSVTFSVEKGETLGLLGPNGSGKTTIMRMITGYLPPTDGSVVIDGVQMYDQPADVKRKIGYLPEHPPIYHDMTVREYLRFAGEIRGVKGDILDERVRDVAGLCGIADKLGRLAGNLSKGYRQRVGLAQALVHDPEILVLDEPTVGLDPKQIIEIRDLIASLGRERTVILSSHILQEVTSICRKVAIINEGKLVAFDTIDNLSATLAGGRRLLVTVARPDKVDAGRLEALPAVSSVRRVSDSIFEIVVEGEADMRDSVSMVLVEMDAGVVEMKTVSMNLEDIFLKVITGQEVSR